LPFYIGVDGGGTKTAFALFNEKKELLLLREGPGSNHENLEGSFDQAAQILWEGIHALLAEANKALSEIDFTLMGLAGVDHPFQYHALMQRLTRHGLERLEIFNDGFIVIKAGSKSGAAIGLNCGTGTCCNAIDRTGRRVQLAGLGDFSGDIANGTWIAIQAFRLVYDDCVLGLEHTLLKDLLFKEYALQQAEELPLLLAALEGGEGGEHSKALIRLFFAAANAGDAPVLRLVEQMALRGAQLIAAHLRTLDFPDPAEVVLSGSIHTKLPNKPYLDALMQKAEQLSGRKLQFRLLEQPPVVGCIQWILQEYASHDD
jgi:N-acetylglucosamine kinase-like BadF-type ATPase